MTSEHVGEQSAQAGSVNMDLADCGVHLHLLPEPEDLSEQGQGRIGTTPQERMKYSQKTSFPGLVFYILQRDSFRGLTLGTPNRDDNLHGLRVEGNIGQSHDSDVCRGRPKADLSGLQGISPQGHATLISLKLFGESIQVPFGFHFVDRHGHAIVTPTS